MSGKYIYTERAHFRLIRLPCCDFMACWVNPRLPNYCPECGKFVYAALKTEGDRILISDDSAEIKYRQET